MTAVGAKTAIRSRLAKAALAPIAAAVVIAVMDSGAIPPYQAYSVALAAVYTIVVLSVGLLAGWSGIWSVGHPAFFALGAYFAAYGSAHAWSLELIVVGAIAASAILGGFLGFAGARFSTLYIALLTLAFSLVSLEVINRWTDVTGGDQGVPVSQVDSLAGELPSGGTQAQVLAVAAAGVCLAIAVLVKGSALRMRLVAAKSHPMVAQSIGIAPEAQSALSFAVSAAFTGFAGVLLGLMTGFVSPDPFSLNMGISLIASCVLGGVGTVLGAVVGGAYLAWSPTLAGAAGLPQPVVQGIVLIAVLIFLPSGVVPFLGKLVRRILPSRETHPVVELQPQPEPEAKVASPDGPPVLTLNGVSVRFGGLKALEDASLSVRRGEVLAIIGPNGAGKTTLMNVLSGLTGGGQVDGTADYAGKQLLRTRPTARRRLGVGRTFQHAEAFSELTVAENVLCTHRWITPRHRAVVDELLGRVGLADVADRYPADLSFGLQKRLDLARAMAEEPTLLVLDEPFGGLDAEERATAAQQIKRLRDNGATVVIIDHVLDDLFAVADRVVAFDFGRPIGEGPPSTVLQNSEVLASYLGTTSARTAPPERSGDEPVAIRLTGIDHHYGGVAALHGVDLEVRAGVVLGVVGANGAGKSTLGRILHGSLRPSSGIREVDGVRASVVPEGRALFKTLTLRENLEVAAYSAGLKGATLREKLDETAEWLPKRLRDRLSVQAAALSGGEQQILAIARAMMAGPDVLIVDEPALGLAPALIDEVYERIGRLADDGMTVVLLEQLLSRAMTACHEVIVLHEGSIAARGKPADTGFAALAEAAYFGGERVTALEVG
ncbi:ABC-type branched-subunit amino acid transport system ATPase component/ABC-type branched-subunit amino acid transport system permease subunit [Kibdelosporangium banguiense]|uniref:ABC-type branched-subunit amino acid transport system ATPase component/ABC-type branched-subunit amino acid transport system permease subunit n=1 Tax=Kibdelosporangium banguiense TaxID=1365924 RepID=A0ABS4TPY7_9PSEU|nr:ATP-binding cassette domain-containing protein [Kibdelosporangium banguiense]MBP2326049.1 ABC-type branched-subunit amino acid transport system ATPase component/ABC-type branched-subunit amino acid transport system permease subunit [Kibdelosporangium banguiense]